MRRSVTVSRREGLSHTANMLMEEGPWMCQGNSYNLRLWWRSFPHSSVVIYKLVPLVNQHGSNLYFCFTWNFYLTRRCSLESAQQNKYETFPNILIFFRRKSLDNVLQHQFADVRNHHHLSCEILNKAGESFKFDDNNGAAIFTANPEAVTKRSILRGQNQNNSRQEQRRN